MVDDTDAIKRLLADVEAEISELDTEIRASRELLASRESERQKEIRDMKHGLSTLEERYDDLITMAKMLRARLLI